MEAGTGRHFHVVARRRLRRPLAGSAGRHVLGDGNRALDSLTLASLDADSLHARFARGADEGVRPYTNRRLTLSIQRVINACFTLGTPDY
ncbi:hypothetical protein SBA1_350039 [Candidatus Sulfotelmatobacter kueseliae]|uniref:Uncharacterized protein n=1 Tax=Candidatus Sulfotelmatobacter kueseliae TaxID=2042962 RepID=A0A2U3KNS8_9BACT|nr:hypothetical protein SBA1_350039 [Candidatus Sulfotelmatobacter kueseliae]